MRCVTLRILAFFCLLAISAPTNGAESPPVSTQPATDRAALRRRLEPAIQRGLAYLAQEQSKDGGWHHGLSHQFSPGITALAVKCFLQDPRYGSDHSIAQRGIAYMLKHQHKDGGIYNQSSFATYMTSVALMALASSKNPDLLPAIQAAQNFLKNGQYDEHMRDDKGNVIDSGHPWYGGAGHGGKVRPDLSHTQMMLEALHESGLPADDPVYQKAVKFIERCQMSSQTNDQPFARGAEDGGFIYTPAHGEGDSKAGKIEADGRTMPRSYGSMTYAGFKSLLYAKLDRNDPRVRQAWEWIRKYYTLEENPNMPGKQSKEGLFYFYHAFARALKAWGAPTLTDAQGKPHDWRMELSDRLVTLQRSDGSWVNSEDRFAEGDPHLVTAYAILALQTTLEE